MPGLGELSKCDGHHQKKNLIAAWPLLLVQGFHYCCGAVIIQEKVGSRVLSKWMGPVTREQMWRAHLWRFSRGRAEPVPGLGSFLAHKRKKVKLQKHLLHPYGLGCALQGCHAPLTPSPSNCSQKSSAGAQHTNAGSQCSQIGAASTSHLQ